MTRAVVKGVVAALMLSAGVPVQASTKYLEVEPGWSKRADAEKALGAPVFTMTEFLVEHRPQDGTGPIYVEYRLGTDVVDRIEVKFLAPVDRGAVMQAMNLPAQPAASTVSSDGALAEYFGEGASLVLVFAGRETSTGVTAVHYQSDRLFDREVKRVPPAGPAPTGTSTSAGGAGGAGGTGGAPAVPLASTTPPSVRRDPLACYDLYTWSQQEEEAARKGRQVGRRQMAMGIRIASQAGDCERARTLVEQYKQRFGGRF